MVSVIEFDFAAKQDRAIDLVDVPAALASGRFCWIDAAAPDDAEIEVVFSAVRLNPAARAEIVGPDREGRIDVHDDALHVSLTAVSVGGEDAVATHVDVVVGAGFLLTFHRGPADFLDRMRRTFHEDFVRFSRSHGFLLYELADHLLDQHRRALATAADAVDDVQAQLFRGANDSLFREVARLSLTLNVLRRALLGAREVLHELAARRSPFIPETTQPSLGRMAGAVERLLADANASRDLLNETLNLYLGMVGHRTNRIVTRLTIVSSVFLPLTFLCGVYGMNFEKMPELSWPFGYALFWVVAIGLATTLLWLMRRAHWL